MKRLVIAAVGLAVVGVAVWWFVLRTPPTPSGLQKVTVCQFGQVFIYMPLYVAAEKGYFRDEGLDVTLINGGGDDKTFAAVASGQAQFGVADPTFPAIAREKGQPAVVIGAVVNGATFWGITRKADIPVIRSPKQFRGLRVATYTAPSTNYALMDKTLRENKAEVGDARIVQGAFGTLVAMLDADQADIAMELEPVVSQVEKSGGRVVYSYPEAYGQFLLTGLYTTEEYRAAHPEVCQKMVNALQRAMRYCHEDRAGATAVARKAFPDVDAEVVQLAFDRLVKEKTIPEGVGLDVVAWRNAVNVRLQAGDLKNQEAADKTLDTSFAEKAVRAIPTMARTADGPAK